MVRGFLCKRRRPHMQGAVVEEEELLVGSADAEASIRRGVHVEFDITHAVGEL